MAKTSQPEAVSIEPAPAPANPVEQIKTLVKILQDQKAALQKQIAEIDNQLQQIAIAVGGSAPAQPGRKPRSTIKPKSTGTPYTPREGSYGAHVMEVLKDGTEKDRDTIAKSVEKLVGSDYNEGTLGQAMTALSKKVVIIPVKGKRGFWIMNK